MSLVQRLARVGILLIVAGYARQAVANNYSSDCEAPLGFHSITRRSDLPPSLAIELQDASVPAESLRYPGGNANFIWNKGQFWIVGYDSEAVVAVLSVSGYKVSNDGKTATEIASPENGSIMTLEAQCNAAFGLIRRLKL